MYSPVDKSLLHERQELDHCLSIRVLVLMLTDCPCDTPPGSCYMLFEVLQEGGDPKTEVG